MTFDDGPSVDHDYTQRLIAVLKENHVPATFFVSPAAMGEDKVQLDARCALIKKLTEAGMEIGVHNWKHEKSSQFSLYDLGNNIKRTKEWLNICGARNVIMYRPPFGVLSVKGASYITNVLKMVIAMWNGRRIATENCCMISCSTDRRWCWQLNPTIASRTWVRNC